MVVIIVIVVVFLIARSIFRGSRRYQVLVKVRYDNLINEDKWTPMYSGTYGDCKNYIRNAKRNSTHSLGFREEFKLKRMDF